MLPDLGKYTATVLSAYGASLALLAGLLWISIAQGRRARARLEEIEKRGENNG